MAWGFKQSSKLTENLLTSVKRIQKSAPLDPEVALIRWLQKIYRQRRLLNKKSSSEVAAALGQIKKSLNRKVRGGPMPILVEACASDIPHLHPKTRTRYANALSWAYVKGTHSDDLKTFLIDKGNGGIAGCDEKFRAYKKKNPTAALGV